MSLDRDIFATAKKIIEHMPSDWLKLTTHRLDIYDESKAKLEFLDRLSSASLDEINRTFLEALPTAYDYIRLGHPLSCVLEWVLAEINSVKSHQVITFASKTMPIMAVLRKAHLAGEKVFIYHSSELPRCLDLESLREFYGYRFETVKVDSIAAVGSHEHGIALFVASDSFAKPIVKNQSIHFSVNIDPQYGSMILVHDSTKFSGTDVDQSVSEIQHVRRRETIAPTPHNSFAMLQEIVSGEAIVAEKIDLAATYKPIYESVKANSGSAVEPLVASSGLSIQYAITMGLIEQSWKNFPDRKISLMVPSNCYGGTNDQARRVAKCFPNVDYIDLHVDGGSDMVASIRSALETAAANKAVPIIIAEIPTNPRVEVPNMDELVSLLEAKPENSAGEWYPDPIFVLDQTFCPNIPFLADSAKLSNVRVISYVSGSKFPSGGLCTAGYCVANQKAKDFMPAIKRQLMICDNEASMGQLKFMAEQMPSMAKRIQLAFDNTKLFVDGIKKILPEAKINFIAEDLIDQGFTPSVFSLDLPASGNTPEEKEHNKRELNLKLINHMIGKNPDDCKYCVSYGQLKASYWTIPATSTQGTTQEGHKDYIVRVSVSPSVDVDKLLRSFREFCDREI